MRCEAVRRVTPVILLAALAVAQPAFAQDNKLRLPFLSGRVTLEDGSVPPKPVAIERVCSGFTMPEGVTDRMGRFRIELGRYKAVTADASVADPDGGIDLANSGASPVSRPTRGPQEADQARRDALTADMQSCELRAVLPGFLPEPINMTGLRRRDKSGFSDVTFGDVGTIVLRRILTPKEILARNVELERSRTAKVPPVTKVLTETEKTLAKARQALRESKIPEAQRELEHLVELEASNAPAWYELGRIYEQQGRRADASRSYTSAIAADATLAGPYAMLAGLQAQDQQWKELADTTDKLIRLNPVDVPAAYFYKAVANYNLGDVDEAEKAARQGLQIDTQHQVPRLHHMLGSILADDRNFAEAAEQMKLYVQYAPAAKDRDDAQKLAGEWATLAGGAPAGVKPQ